MVLGDRVQTHKDKLNKETKNDTFRSIQNPGTPKGDRSMTSHLIIINKYF